MDTDSQYREDSARLAGLIERFTGIPKERIFFFVMQNAAAELLPCANIICETSTQREKLSALFEFKNLYETVKGAEKNREHTLSGTDDAKEYFKSHYADMNDKERVSVAFLDSQCRVITTKIISTGTVNESSEHPREIIKEALFNHAASVMVAHNHPGGSPYPSEQDLLMTERVKQGLDAIGIKLLDHIIVAGDKAISFADMGKMPISNTTSANAKAASPVREERDLFQQKSEQPSIRQQLAAAKRELAADCVTAPVREAVKSENNAWEV